MSMYQRGLAQALDRWHGRRVLLGHAKDAVMRDEEIGMLPRTVQLGYGVRHVRLETTDPPFPSGREFRELARMSNHPTTPRERWSIILSAFPLASQPQQCHGGTSSRTGFNSCGFGDIRWFRTGK